MKISKSRLQQFLKEYTSSDKTTFLKTGSQKDLPAESVTGENKRKAVFEITQNKIFEKLVTVKPAGRK